MSHDRYCLDRLQHLHIPPAWREQIDFASITIRSLPFLDKEALLPVCYRCGTTNPLLTVNCVACGHEFIRSFCSFDILPLVEFCCEADIEPDEAQRLIDRAPDGASSGGGGGGVGGGGGGRDEWRQTGSEGFNRMEVGDDDDGSGGGGGGGANPGHG
jgi:intraflagellar transport protein 122